VSKQKEKPVISHIHSTSVSVADQDAALDFYVNTLGWEKADDAMFGEGMRWLTVVPPGATTQLALAHESWSGKPGGQTGISLVAPDIDATYEALSAKGVAFKGPVEVMPWGTKATWFSDPDGNEFFLVEG
jgi:catechol 2,3-dioxygenase-like lactoylglutathione lyase family enzyme